MGDIKENDDMSLFAKAKEKSATSTASKPKKCTTWVVGDPQGDQVGKAIHELCELTAQEKAIAAKKKLFSTVVAKHAKEHYVRDFCELGVSPDTPMTVQNADGEKVTYVVQDRGGQYNVKEEQIDGLKQLLGADLAESMLYSETSFGFDRAVFAIDGVAEAVEKALSACVERLVDSGVLDGDQADNLITAKTKTSFKPGTLDRAAEYCGRDTTRLGQFLDLLGSSCTRYIKS